MKELEISIKETNLSDLLKDRAKILCKKCGGSGNIKSPENIRKTCLNCFGRGYEMSQ
tara:strand:+ start:747 stop:917 length:171 start_codon:yes stop_codon:yes gene_type:complete